MPMRATTVRFSEDLWGMLEREASQSGVSAAQFVREATILRLAMLAGMRGDEAARMTLSSLAARAQGARGGHLTAAVTDPKRLAALRETGLLDSEPDERFDGLARVAARALDTPVALVTLVDRDRQFLKACIGLEEPWASKREMPLSHSFCQHAVAARTPLIVGDAREDPMLRDNEAIRQLKVIAYAGIPLIATKGEALGTLCVIDHKPRTWRPEDKSLLEEIAAAVVSQLEAA